MIKNLNDQLIKFHFFILKVILLGCFCNFSGPLVKKGHASSGNQANQFNNSNYKRIINQTVSDILPPPLGDFDQERYQIQKNKLIFKLQGEANEELLTSLMSLSSTLSPNTANDLDEIISKSNTFLTTEKGAVDATLLLSQGLDQLEIDLENLSNLEKSIQLETLVKHLESFDFMKRAILDKYNRYQNYNFNEQSSGVIADEQRLYNLCEGGTPPAVKGLSSIIDHLDTTISNNQTTIINLTSSINNNLNSYPLPLATRIVDIDLLIADPATDPAKMIDLNLIKAEMENKEQFTTDNVNIQICKVDIGPKIGGAQRVKTEENSYLNNVTNSILDPGASIRLPLRPNNYTQFNLNNICLVAPASISTEINQLRNNCHNWINYYKSLYIIPNINISSASAIGDQRYLAISNCGRSGRTCAPQPMNRIGNELKALGLFPLGRIIIVEMLSQSIDLAKDFYTALLSTPQLFNCELLTDPNIQVENLNRLSCYKQQKEGLTCQSGAGLDCDRAEIGLLIYQLKIDSLKTNNIVSTTTRVQGENQENQVAGRQNNALPPSSRENSTSPLRPNSLNNGPINNNQDGDTNRDKASQLANLNSGELRSLDVKITKNSKLKNNNQLKRPRDFTENTAFANLSLSGQGAKLVSRGSYRTVQKFFNNKFRLNKKLRKNFKSSNKNKIAKAIVNNLARPSLEKISNSFGAKDHLFASAIPRPGAREKNSRASKTIRPNPSSKTQAYQFKRGSKYKSQFSNILPRQKRASKKDDPYALENNQYLNPYLKNKSNSKEALAKIHSRKIGLFEIISRRFRRTDIYFDNTYE